MARGYISGWDGTSLSWRRGTPVRLRGVDVFYDFRWRDVFPDERTQFKNGKCLADLVVENCSEGKRPALLLTRTPDVTERWLINERYHCLIVNIDNYLQASGDAARTYFSRLSSLDPVSALSTRPVEISIDEAALLDRLSPALLHAWLAADLERLNDVANLLIEFAADSERGGEAIKPIFDSFIALVGDNIWEAIARAGKDLPQALAHAGIWRKYAAQTARFQQHLQDRDWDEGDWQKFFVENEWIFGYGLRPQFLHLVQDRPNLGGSDITGTGGQEGDYLMATVANISFTLLIEIKRPDAQLVSNIEYRNRVYGLGEDLVAGITQLQQQCWRWGAEASSSNENRDLLESQNIYTHEPRGLLVIGNTASVAGNRAKLKTFEGFRRNLWRPDVITYDELLRRTEFIVNAQLDVKDEGVGS